tara:strand:- start:247 stop:600 length:354 start_codon:yes stop_codon:yes gene_type:complete
MTEAIIYYRKDHDWLSKTPFAPPSIMRLDELDEVHRMIINEHLIGLELEDIWKTMQNIDGGDMPEQLGVRSMMVGDIVVITDGLGGDDKGWQVEATGWTPVSSDWLANERFYSKPLA